jgi:hypothetical protein
MKFKTVQVALLTACLIFGTVTSQTTHSIETGITSLADNIYHEDTDNNDGTPRTDKAEVVAEFDAAVKVGDMIAIDLSGSLGGGFDYAVEPTPPNLRTFNNGKIIVCGTGAQNVTYTFMISCALGGDSDVGVFKIKVTGAPTEPVAPVDPGNEMTAKARKWAALVDTHSRRDDAIKLAQSFSSVAIIIEQNTFNTPTEVVKATATSNRDALGSQLEQWIPFLDALMNELEAMAELGQLSSVEDHAPVWRAVAMGLREFADTLE